MTEYMLADPETLYLPVVSEGISRPNLGKLEKVTAMRGLEAVHPEMKDVVRTLLAGTHFCAVMRGVRQPEGLMRIQAVRGESQETRKLLLDLASDR